MADALNPTQEPINQSVQQKTTPAEKTFSQAEVDRIVSARVNEINAKYSTYKSPEDVAAITQTQTEQITRLTADLTAANAALTAHAQQAEKVRIAEEVGIPSVLADRLTGDDEAAWKADAEKIKAGISTSRGIVYKQPGVSTEPASTNSNNQSNYESLEGLRAKLFDR